MLLIMLEFASQDIYVYIYSVGIKDIFGRKSERLQRLTRNKYAAFRKIVIIDVM